MRRSLRINSIFTDEDKLDIKFVPEKLLHREMELSQLSQLFLPLLTNPNSVSRKILITGKKGVGKTATVRLFGRLLIKTSKKKKSQSINYIAINCRKESVFINMSTYLASMNADSLHSFLKERDKYLHKIGLNIIEPLNRLFFPKKVYSPQDLLEEILDFLTAQDSYLLLVLDELNYLISKNGDFIDTLTRLNKIQRISYIGIVRDSSCLNDLDVASALKWNTIKFKMYSKEQIFDILKYRAEISMKKECFSDKILDMVSAFVLENGDIRYGLKILRKAGIIAEEKGLNQIKSECVNLSISSIQKSEIS